MFRAKHSSRRISSTHDLGEDTVECTTWIDRLRGRRRFKRRVRYHPYSLPAQVQRPPLLPEARVPASLKSDPLLRLLLVTFLLLLIAAVAIFLIHQYVELQGSLQGMAKQYQAIRGKG
jgi:hypothetical protein